MTQCTIPDSDFILYISVLLVLALIFPMIDLVIFRVTWFYKDDIPLPQDVKRKARPHSPYSKDSSFFSRSLSSRSTPVHPFARTQATLVFSNSETLLDDNVDPQRIIEETIVYGKSTARNLSFRDAKVETISQFRQSIESNSSIKRTKSTVVQGQPAVRIESLPGIETPHMSAKRRSEKITQVTEAHGETFRNIPESVLPEITRVTPVMKQHAISVTTHTSHQGTEFLERLADSSVLYQDKYEVDYINSYTDLEISTPDQAKGDMRLLNRPDKSRRRVAKLDTSLPNK